MKPSETGIKMPQRPNEWKIGMMVRALSERKKSTRVYICAWFVFRFL